MARIEPAEQDHEIIGSGLDRCQVQREKPKKVLEAKAVWDEYEGEKNMKYVNELSDKYNVKGGRSILLSIVYVWT